QGAVDGWDITSLPAGVYALDVVGGVVNNIEDIVNYGPITINGEDYMTIKEYLTEMTRESGDVKIVYDGTTGDVIFQEWNEATETWENVDNSKFATIVEANESKTL